MTKKLEVGDKIANIGNSGATSIGAIDRVTEKTAWSGTVSFKREYSEGKYLNEIGRQKWSSTYYCIATDEHFKEVRIRNARNLLTSTSWFKVSGEKVLEIVKMLKQ